MNCLHSVTTNSSGGVAQCASSNSTGALDDEEDFGGHTSRPPKYIGAPLIMEAASKVDKCLARLHSLQGTVTVPKVHLSSVSSAALSPHFSRSRSCLHGSPKVHENDKIRIHDVLRWSDDFSGKYKQDRREKYRQRLIRSSTQVFDDKKNPLDPHGEWKHWSSPAGDVHKVISEILMASQIAKQITSMVNAATVQSDVSSDEGKKVRLRLAKENAVSPNPMTDPSVEQKRKGDPLHKFRVVVATNGPAAKKRLSVGRRKEVLYPKSKQQPSLDLSRLVDVSESTAKKMQARRSPRSLSAKESKAQEETWAAKDLDKSKASQPRAETTWAARDVTNSKSHHPQAEVRAARDLTSSKSHHPQAEVRAAKDVSRSKPQQLQAETRVAQEIINSESQQPQPVSWAAKEITNSNSHQQQADVRAPQNVINSTKHQSQANMWAAKDVTNSRSHNSQAGLVRAVKDITNSRSHNSQADVRAVKEVSTCKSRQSHADTRAVKDVSTRKSHQSHVDSRPAKDISKSHVSQEDLRGIAKEIISNSKSRHSRSDYVRAAREISINTSRLSHADVSAARDISSTKSHSHHSPGDVRASRDISSSKSHHSRGDVRASKDIPTSKPHHSHADVRAGKDISHNKSEQPQAQFWSANEITNSKSHQSEADVRAKDIGIGNSKSQPRGAVVTQDLEKPVQQAPYSIRRVRGSQSPSHTLVEKPKLSTSSSKSVHHVLEVKHHREGPQHILLSLDPRMAVSSSTNVRGDQPTPNIKANHHSFLADTLVLPSKTEDKSSLRSSTESLCSSGTVSEIKLCNSPPAAVSIEKKLGPARPKKAADVKLEKALAASIPEIRPCIPFESDVMESRTGTPSASPQHERPSPAERRLDPLRHEFVMEATEVKGPQRFSPWQSKSSKAVMFSNAIFAPASPTGARPVSEKRQGPAAASPEVAPRSRSAPRRLMDRIGRAVRRSVSPDIRARLKSTGHKLMQLSPAKSLPSLISRLPSRGKRRPSPVFPANITKSASCTKPCPTGNLPLPPGRRFQQRLAPTTHQKLRVLPDPAVVADSPPKVSTDSYFSLRMLKDLNGNAQQVPFKITKGATPDNAPSCSRLGPTGITSRQIKNHSNLDWEKEVGVSAVLSSCRKWVLEAAPPRPGGVCKYEKENVVPPAPQRILINENVVATGWDDEAAAPSVLSTSRSRKVEDFLPPCANGTGFATPGDLSRSCSKVRRSFSTGRVRPGGPSFLKRARDWMRTQTPNRMRSQEVPNWWEPRQSGLVI